MKLFANDICISLKTHEQNNSKLLNVTLLWNNKETFVFGKHIFF